ncbi:MAG TPA: class I mannose-6-phosphate isomerase [Acidothermaceae bacterium]|nr:class I mannose-6-phosphate isomerase [Acidothermaceae bacterium]
MEPVSLPANQPQQFYLGGPQIEAFRGEPSAARPHSGSTFAADPARTPEDWVASTLSKFGSLDGATRLPDGELLSDAVTARPEDFFSPTHIARFGANPALLVKLLDAGERLPVHCHPDRAFAGAHLGSVFGKTEAWIIIGTSAADPHVYLGFNRDVSAAELSDWFVNQNSADILGSMNRITVATGDAIFVPAGTPHAIGAGALIVELQEPTDFSVMLEWREFGMPDRREEQLGMSAELSLQCFNRHQFTDADLATCHRRATASHGGTETLFPKQAEPFFQAHGIVVPDVIELDAQYAVLIVLDGEGTLITATSELELHRGSTVLIPYSAGPTTLRGSLHVIRCLPGDPALT